jgi:hypothetical protein
MDKETVERAKKESDEAYLVYSNLKAQYQEAEKDWLKKSRRFQDFDYQLALVDGRFKKLPPAGECKQKKEPELSLDQIKTIATNLGINISVETDLSDKDAVDSIMEEDNEQSMESQTEEG